MEYKEVPPLPFVCQECMKTAAGVDCYECDHAGERWSLSKLDELRLKEKSLEKAIQRYQDQLYKVKRQIEGLENGNS